MEDLGGMPGRFEEALRFIAVAHGTSVNDQIVQAIRTVRPAELRNLGVVHSHEYGYGTHRNRVRMNEVPPELVKLAMNHAMSAQDIMLRAVERHIWRMMVDDAMNFAVKLALVAQDVLKKSRPAAVNEPVAAP